MKLILTKQIAETAERWLRNVYKVLDIFLLGSVVSILVVIGFPMLLLFLCLIAAFLFCFYALWGRLAYALFALVLPLPRIPWTPRSWQELGVFAVLAIFAAVPMFLGYRWVHRNEKENSFVARFQTKAEPEREALTVSPAP